jgi:hypothetical protein
MKRYFSKQQRLEVEFRLKVAEKFGIKPISIRASKLLDKHFESGNQVKQSFEKKQILKIRQMGKKTLRELLCAFGFCQEEGLAWWTWHHDCCSFSVRLKTNYREELGSYAQIFRKHVNVSQLT